MTIASNQTVLIIGASSGIGQALSHKFAQSSEPSFTRVMITSRSQATADQPAAEHPKLQGVAFDPNQIERIPEFVRGMVDQEGVTFVVINAGTMHGFDFTKPDEIDFSEMQAEVHTNLIAPMALVKEFVAAFNCAKVPATICVTTSGLALVPLTRAPAYTACKFGLRAFTMAVRRQLEEKSAPGTNFVRLVEIVPPAVQTPLFDKQPDLKDKPAPPRTPLPEYINDLFPRLVAGEEKEIGYGFSAVGLATVGKAQWEAFNKMPI